MEVDKKYVEEKSCNRRFRFGEKVYQSKKEVSMPIIMKAGEDDCIKKIISVNVIDREKDLFLCGLKTLREWNLWYFMRRMKWNLVIVTKELVWRCLRVDINWLSWCTSEKGVKRIL